MPKRTKNTPFSHTKNPKIFAHSPRGEGTYGSAFPMRPLAASVARYRMFVSSDSFFLQVAHLGAILLNCTSTSIICTVCYTAVYGGLDHLQLTA